MSSIPPSPARQSVNRRLYSRKSQNCPPIAVFCRLVRRLQAPNCDNLRAKSPIVSGGYLKYSRFRETATGDRVRAGLRGRALESWEPAMRAAAREIACKQPAESSGGRGSRRGERWYDCGSLPDLTGGPLQTPRTNGRTPREPLPNSRAKGGLQGGRMQCVCCAHARPQPSAHPSLPGYHRLGRARSG